MRPVPEHLLDLREFPVLFVDDEPENLRLVERGLGQEFTVLAVASGEEALRLVRERPVAVVLSDQRMPGMSGVELLARVRALEPRTIRILVTAYGDAATLREAINDGSVYRFVPKPWSPEDLRLTVRRAVEVYALDRERDELVRELALLNWVSKVISQELDLDALLDLLLETLTRELGYEAATLLLFDAGREALVPARSAPPGRSRPAPRVPAGEAPGFFRRLRAGEAQWLGAGGSAEAPAQALLAAAGAAQMLVVPMLAKGELLGALAVDDRGRAGGFAASDLTLLEGLASQAAIGVGNARLVEDLRRSRQQVLRGERLGTLGTLAAGLAHEINNPLVSVHTFLALAPAKRSEADPAFWGEYHGLACREVERIRGLVATMARLGRGASEPAPRTPCEPEALAREVTTLLAREAGARGVALGVEADPGTPKVVAAREELQQVLLNLVLNALHATPRGGTVVVRTRPEGRERICFEVCDTGRGIPAADLERIFDPFYTTKDPDQGTGLGLMICHGIVTDHGGSIEVESREGQGATFRVRLPREGGGSG